jgi:glyoxylase-like metal-dependent hydrolase (beta-lactamase superfamily II)
MRLLVVACGLMLVRPAPVLLAQTSPLESYRQAQEVLERALVAHGGRDRVQTAARQFTLVLDGELVHRNQSPSAARSVGTPFRMVLAGDLERGRIRAERVGSYPGGFDWTNIDVVDSGRTRQANVGARTVTTQPGGDVANYRAMLERLPHFVLARLDNDRRGLSFAGRSTRDGRRVATIVAPVNATTLGWYHFDDKTGLLSSWERMIGDDYAGDAVVRVVPGAYRSEAGLMIPGTIDQFTGVDATHRMRTTLAVLGQAPAESLFALAANLTDTPRQPPEEATFDQVGPGVYLASGLAGGYRLLVADLGDHLAVMESPNGSAQCERAIARIGQQFPGKPIRYVIPTHHHDDHAGGLRAFIAAGATVVTTRGNEAPFRQMAAAQYTIQPDEQSRVRKPVQFEFVDRRKVLEGGGTRVEILDMGPGPHADEMLIAYLPASGFVFQGDLFNTGGGSADTWGNLTTVHFAEWIGKSGLTVEKIGGTHSPVRTREELDVAARRVQQTAAH